MEWKPIEGAPKDGTKVLLRATRGNALMPRPETVVGEWSAGWWSGMQTLSHVTYYTDLLPPPNEDGR